MSKRNESKTGKNAPSVENKIVRQTNHVENRELTLGTQDLEDEIQLKRREAYIERPTQKLLRNLLKDEIREEVLPSYDPVSGFIYKTQESAFEENVPAEKVTEFLEHLTRLDILKKTFHDAVSVCPNCKSTLVTLHNRCPKCKSHNVVKASLTEHIPCGNIDEKEKYADGLCPKCGEALNETTRRDMGRWYICRQCGEKFEHPQSDVVCRKCNTIFNIEEAEVVEVPKYVLNTERKKEIRQNVTSLESISNLLTELGFKIEMPGSVTGHKSGMKYHFSLLAKKQTEGKESVIAVDHAVAEDEVQASPLIIYIYKTSEMKVDLPIFIALPKLSETAKKIAKGHDILIIEGSPEGHDRIAQIKVEIESRIDQKAIVQLEPKAASKSAIKSENAPQVLTSSSVSPDSKHKGIPLMGMLRKLKQSKNIEYPSVVEETSEETQLRNIVFLLDGSSSMRNGMGDLSKFELARKAIKNVLTNPNPLAKDNMLSVIIFWSEFFRGFQKEVLYKNVSMSTYINPQKLNLFEKPKKNVGTPVSDAVEYAIDFLQSKKGNKIVKLITDAVGVPPLKDDDAIISKLKNSSIQLDCIIVGSEGNLAWGKVVSNAKLGRFFVSSNVESLALALRA